MIVHAVNVHVGGGKVLLDELLLSSPFGKVTLLFCDQRYFPPLSVQGVKVIKIAPRLKSRIGAEFQLKKYASQSPNEDILFFGNLPPLLKLKNKVIVYVQNAFVLKGVPLPHREKKVVLRYFYERLWFWLGKKNVDEFWVQSDVMVGLMKKTITKTPVLKKPFLPYLPTITKQTQPKFKFLTVVSASSQKRLEHFLEALIALAHEGQKPATLVISDWLTEIQKDYLAQLKNLNFPVEVKLDIGRDEIFEAYSTSEVLVNNSDIESFCLPLFEAKHAGLQIISSDQPYAREASPHARFYKPGDIKELTLALRRSLEKAH